MDLWTVCVDGDVDVDAEVSLIVRAGGVFQAKIGREQHVRFDSCHRVRASASVQAVEYMIFFSPIGLYRTLLACYDYHFHSERHASVVRCT